jgi:tRNA (Thr-GGU) A37 N-methylase
LDASGAPRSRIADPVPNRRNHRQFALRSPVRPNPIALSIVGLLAIDVSVLQVRGLDCLDGTPLIDLKPERATPGE